MEVNTERQKFESFKFGGATIRRPNSLQQTHSRKGSRTSSISSSTRRPLSLNGGLESLNFAEELPATESAASAAPGNSSASTHVRLNSHHRRRSSVSTRRESADLMGVVLADIPQPKQDECDRDSIRRRALLALEGKENTSFAKVEIPELTSFDSGTFSFAPTNVSSSHTINKRESQSMFINMSKDHLGTLIEEDEEDPEDHSATSPLRKEVASIPNTTTTTTSSLPTTMEDDSVAPKPYPAVRPRPASLQLRPLALISGSNLVAAARSLPTPTLTPTMSPPVSASSQPSFYRAPKGLRSLSLSASINIPPDSSPPIINNRRQSLILSSPTSSPSPSSARRPSLSLDTESSSSPISPPRRRSSIQYRKSISQDSTTNEGDDSAGLPTPDTTPVTSRANSLAEEPVALTTSEQQFLFKSHQTLLSRITDLERALRMRSNTPSSMRHRSRASSSGSSASSSSEVLMRSEPSSMMAQLVNELKEEREDLRRDIVGWKSRVADLEKQVMILNGRVEAERLESWNSWNKLGGLETERKRLEAEVTEKDVQISHVTQECNRLQELYSNEQVRREEAEDEIITLRRFLAEEKTRTSPRANIIPIDVEDESFPNPHDDSDEDPLAGYEDEHELDVHFGELSSTESSLDEHEGLVSIKGPECPSLIISDYSTSPSPPPVTPQPSHDRTVSLSRWTFPSSLTTPTRTISIDTDNFFGIEDADHVPLSSASEYDSQSLFSQSLRLDTFDEDDDSSMPPFVLPAHVGTEVVKKPVLGALMEEDEPLEEEEEPISDFDEMELAGEERDGIMRFAFKSNISVMVTPPTADNTPDALYRRQMSLSKIKDTPSRKRTESADTSILTDEDVDMSLSRRKVAKPVTKPASTVSSSSSIPRKPPPKRSTLPSMIPKGGNSPPSTSPTRIASKIPMTSRLPQRPTSTSPTPRSPKRTQTVPLSPKPMTPYVPTPTRISSPSSSSSASSASTVTGKASKPRRTEPKSPSVLDSIFGLSESATKPGFVSREAQLVKLHKKLCSSDYHTLNPKGGFDACSKCKGKQVTI